MNDTNGSSERISNPAPAIDEVAFQASLSALSMAVEAAAAQRAAETGADTARPGEHQTRF
jgi:methyl-accepting chemotaxis protein